MDNVIIGFDPQQQIIAYQTPTFQLDLATHQVATNDKLESFAELPLGWHYGEGIPPGDALISCVTEINNQVYRLGFSRTDAFPGISGNIMLTIYQGKHMIDLTVEPDCKTATYLYENDGEEIAYHEGIELSIAMKMIEQVGELCRSSEPYIRFTTLKLNTGSRVLPLKLLMTGEYLFSPQTAQLEILKAFVNISTNITSQLESPALLPSIGNSMSKSYLLAASESP